jgi:hypothetical protein
MATENAAFLPRGDRARVPQGHGGSRRRGRPRHGGERRRRLEKGAKGPALPSRLQRTRAGVHACARVPRPARACARTRTRRGCDAGAPTRCGGDQTGRRPTARGERLGGWRARQRRQRHLQKIATQPGSMAGITSSGAAARWRGTFRLGAMAVASTGEKKRRPHLGGHWPRRRRR